MKPLTTAVALGTPLSLLVVAAALALSACEGTGDHAKKLDRFCLATKMAMHEDHRDLASGDTATQEAAAKRFWSKEIYHGPDSLAFCIDESKVPQIPLGCPMTEDKGARLKCLADFAAKVDQLLQ